MNLETIRKLWDSGRSDDREIVVRILATRKFEELEPLLSDQGLLKIFPLERGETYYGPVFSKNFVIFSSCFGFLRISKEGDSIYNSFRKNYRK